MRTESVLNAREARDMADTAQRLLQLLSLLQRRVRWTGPDLAERLGVTTRTVRRDVERLRRLGYPVDAGPGPDGGYQLGAGGDLPPLLLDDEEAVAVAVALSASAVHAAWGIEHAALAALTKLERLLPPKIKARVHALQASTELLSVPADAISPEVLTSVAQAIDGHERIVLSYVDREQRRTERRVEPYRLVATNRRWYLLAMDVDRSDWRTFRVDRIAGASRTGHRFVPSHQPDAKRMVSEAISNAPYRFQARIRFETPPSELARRIPPSVGSIEAYDSGSLLRVGSDHLGALAGHLVSLELPFEVLDPPELREHLVRVGRALAKAH